MAELLEAVEILRNIKLNQEGKVKSFLDEDEIDKIAKRVILLIEEDSFRKKIRQILYLYKSLPGEKSKKAFAALEDISNLLELEV